MLLELSKEEITPAKLYRLIGKFDTVFSIIFLSKSELIKVLGPYINATLVYSKNERENYEKNDDDFINTSSNGFIKIKILYPDLNVQQKLKYELDGIKSSEIYKIPYSPFPYDNFIRDELTTKEPALSFLMGLTLPLTSKINWDVNGKYNLVLTAFRSNSMVSINTGFGFMLN